MTSKEYIKTHLKDIRNIHVKLHDQEWDFEIWPNDKLDEWNEGYNVEENIPGYYAIGSDGGLEMLTVEILTNKVYSIPFISMDSNDRIKVSDNFADLIKKTNK